MEQVETTPGTLGRTSIEVALPRDRIFAGRAGRGEVPVARGISGYARADVIDRLLSMQLELNGHVAVVTGGASGIGAACAWGLEAEGCQVAVWDLSTGVDVSDYAAVQRALAETEARLGPVSHVVHSAATGSGKFGFPFTNLDPADWRRVMEVNVMGMVHVAQACAAGMVARRTGTMVSASIAGQMGSQTDPPYSASKAANMDFWQSWRRIWRRMGCG